MYSSLDFPARLLPSVWGQLEDYPSSLAEEREACHKQCVHVTSDTFWTSSPFMCSAENSYSFLLLEVKESKEACIWPAGFPESPCEGNIS